MPSTRNIFKRLVILFLPLLIVFPFFTSCHNAIGTSDTTLKKEQLDTMSVVSLEDWVKVHPDDLDAFNRLCSIYTRLSEYDKIIDISIPIYNRAKSKGNIPVTVSSGIYLGQSYIMMAKPDSMYKYFGEVTQLAKDNGMDEYVMFISNAIGIHNLMYAMNYNEALHYFYEALSLCAEDDQRNKYVILSNIVNVFYLRNDPSGLDMALEIFNWGNKHNDDQVRYRGALGAAYMYYISKDYTNALKYAELTEQQDTYTSGFSNSDAIHGDILNSLGRKKEAENYYLKGVSGSTDISTRIESYLSYGNFLLGERRYQEAIDNYLSGLELVEKYKMYFYGHRLYSSLSEAYSAIGRDDKAVEYMMTYQNIVDSVFNVEKERSFSNMRLRYEQERKENQLKEKDIMILRQHQRMIIISSVSFVLIVVIVVIFVILRKRTAMYRNLVQRYDSSMKREKLLTEASSPEKQSSDDKLKDLFVKIESLMKDEMLYTNSDVTLDMVADKLQTNRSYISKAVNTFAATSFNGYVNSYRIRRAVEYLSDPDNNTPIKVIAEEIGYNNLTSFYKNFQKETGVPPSRYRQEVLKLPEEVKES